MSPKTWLLRLTNRPLGMAYRRPPLWLEHLEDRSVPSFPFFSQTGNWNVIRVDFSQLPPQDMTVPLWISMQYFLSQWGLGVPYTGQRTLFEIQLGTANFRAAYGGAFANQQLLGTIRTPADILGYGTVAVVFCPTFGIADHGDIYWEEAAFNEGWWYQDPTVGPSGLMPPGPQYGQAFQAPNLLLADLMILQGDPLWWCPAFADFLSAVLPA